jgi:hypothetical protein
MEGLLAVAIKRDGDTWPPPNAPKLQVLIQRMAAENNLWGQRRIQAELTRLGFNVSARTVAKYTLPAGVRIKQHSSAIWATKTVLSAAASPSAWA